MSTVRGSEPRYGGQRNLVLIAGQRRCRRDRPRRRTETSLSFEQRAVVPMAVRLM